MHINIDGKKIDTEEFAEFCELGLMQDGTTVRREAREAYPFHFGNWVTASLVAVTESGAYVLTPRGADLRASLPLLSAQAKPKATIKPCSKCHGTGQQPLFVSMETCSRCKGSKVEPHVSGIDFNNSNETVLDAAWATLRKLGIKDILWVPEVGWSQKEALGRINRETPAVSGHPWVLIDSEEVAQQFVGKRVQIDAAATWNIEAHEAHGLTTTIREIEPGFVLTAIGPIWIYAPTSDCVLSTEIRHDL